MKNPKAILFDLDDTLISFEGVADEAWVKCCGDFAGRHNLPLTAEALFDEIGAVRRWYWSDPERHRLGRRDLAKARREIIRLTFEKLGLAEAPGDELADGYSAYRDTLVCLYPSTLQTLTALKDAGYRLALLTNGSSESQRAKLRRFGLEPFFEAVLIEQEIGYGKPDSRVYERALSLLGLTASDVWMVGDNLVWDVAAPQSLGICSVWHDYKKTGLPADAPAVPDGTIRDIGELIPALCGTPIL